jgi:hypothetical protein
MKKRRKRKLDPRLFQRIIPPPPEPKVSPEFRARLFAYCASRNLKGFAWQVSKAALAGDERFFVYLAQFLKGKEIRLPISKEQIELLKLYSVKPHLSVDEALKELGWTNRSKDYYCVMKQRAIRRYQLILQAARRWH